MSQQTLVGISSVDTYLLYHTIKATLPDVNQKTQRLYEWLYLLTWLLRSISPFSRPSASPHPYIQDRESVSPTPPLQAIRQSLSTSLTVISDMKYITLAANLLRNDHSIARDRYRNSNEPDQSR